MPKTIRRLNSLGVWLNNELGQRGILLSEFAKMANTTPQNLSDVMRSDTLTEATLNKWECKFKEILDLPMQ